MSFDSRELAWINNVIHFPWHLNQKVSTKFQASAVLREIQLKFEGGSTANILFK